MSASLAGTTLADVAEASGTRVLLMMAGEREMGRRGLDGISLEEIAREAGQSNKYAVQYHFGSRDGLIQAILDERLARIEARRGELLGGIDADCSRAIIAAFVRPLAEQVDAAGALSFARLLQRFSLEQGLVPGVHHPMAGASGDTSTMQLFQMLCAALPSLSSEIVARRLVALLQLPLAFLSTMTLEEFDRRQDEFEDILLMMDAALSAAPDATGPQMCKDGG